MKARAAAVADAFNRDAARGLQALSAAGLVSSSAASSSSSAPHHPPPPPTPEDAAALLRHCPGISKEAAGDLLGDADAFAVATLDAFSRSFDFTGATFDGALRAFLASFRLPGEAQKISRIMKPSGTGIIPRGRTCL